MNILQVEGLSKTYANGKQALNNVNLELRNGMFGLLGPNGAGKSTLMRTLSTLQAPTSGRVLFNGQDLQEHPQHLRSQLGYLPQEFGVYPKISAYQLLLHLALLKGVGNKKERHQQVESLLQQTNLYGAKKQAVSSFSGGMRRRFGIAQALLGDPKLIIVDEPTAGLDPEERNRFLNLLSAIGEERIVVLSTHIVEDVRELCTNMAIIGQGQVVSQGTPAALLAQLKGKVWAKIVDKKTLEGYQNKLNVLSSRLHAGKILLHVLSDQPPAEGFTPIEAGLEDVYFSTLSTQKNKATC